MSRKLHSRGHESQVAGHTGRRRRKRSTKRAVAETGELWNGIPAIRPRCDRTGACSVDLRDPVLRARRSFRELLQHEIRVRQRSAQEFDASCVCGEIVISSPSVVRLAICSAEDVIAIWECLP